MMPEHLRETVEQVSKGSYPAFRSLVNMYRQPAYRLAFRILGDEEEAKDAVQDSFVKIWQKIGSFDTSRDFVPWMYRIIANTSADRLRTLRRHPMVPIDQVAHQLEALLQDDSAIPDGNREMALIIRGLTEMLPEKQKLVFILRDLEGMTSEEVEQITEMSDTSVKSNLYHARKSVRERLLKIMEKERSIK